MFDPILDGRKLTFRPDSGNIVDNETGSIWSILGRATEGPLTGEELVPVVHDNNFWFAVAAFKPDTKMYQGSDNLLSATRLLSGTLRPSTARPLADEVARGLLGSFCS